MAIEIQLKCTALVPIVADRVYKIGESVLLPIADATQLVRWGHVSPPSK
jgi:hypothetical protein